MTAIPSLPARVTPVGAELSTRRLNILRFGYALMGVGLAIVQWPVLLQEVRSLPSMSGVVVCLMTALSLLALRPSPSRPCLSL